MSRLVWAWGVLLLATSAWGQSPPLPVGGQFQVNSYTTNSQRLSALALDPAGNFVVVWGSLGSLGSDADATSVQGQRYAAGGAPLGGEFQVNTYTTSDQNYPVVAIDALGDFVVVWYSFGSSADPLTGTILGQRYAAGGSPQGGQFQINTYTTSGQFSPAVGMHGAGVFEIAWSSVGSVGVDNSMTSVQGRRYVGAAGGAQFEVNTYTTSEQTSPSLALDAGGNFVVVWQSNGAAGDSSLFSIQGRRIEADGVPGAQFQVNSYTTNDQRNPKVALNASGAFVVVWDSQGSSGSDTAGTSIQGQRYAAGGAAQGTQFQVNTDTGYNQFDPVVAIDGDGDFVVAWSTFPPGNSSIQGQRFAAGGAALGGQFQINTVAAVGQFASIAAAPSGDFVVTWNGYFSGGNDSSGSSIQGQRFRVTGDLAGKVFYDLDANGLQGPGEVGLSGVTVELRDPSQVVRRTAVTDGLGNYSLQPKEGDWYLRFVAPP
ncbi:MAG: SdrD B-like domain-containing protein, partial [Thermoanaerobaculia bacterium]